MAELYEPCPQTPVLSTVETSVATNANSILSLVGELLGALTERINVNNTALASVAKVALQRLKRRIGQSDKLLAPIIDAAAARMTTRVAENRAVLSTIVPDALAAGLLPPASALATQQMFAPFSPLLPSTPQAEVSATPVMTPTATPTPQATPTLQPPVQPTQPPTQPQPTPQEFTSESQAELRRIADDIAALVAPMQPPARQAAVSYLADSIGAIAASIGGPALVALASLPQNQRLQSAMSAADVTRGQASVTPGAQSEAAETICPPCQVEGGLVPVDLDQPLAFRFSPDDNPWKRAAVAYAGGWLADYLAAPTIDDAMTSLLGGLTGGDVPPELTLDIQHETAS